VIKGGTNGANLIPKPGVPNLVSGLWVTRGAKLYATGTVSSPIIFTMEGDDVSDPDDIPPTMTGQWGGIILMGRAVINSAFDVAGNSANPVTDVYEGVPAKASRTPLWQRRRQRQLGRCATSRSGTRAGSSRWTRN
jgi:hypothetical protein